ncbi:MAG: SDR family oxidoreductase [bacterium]
MELGLRNRTALVTGGSKGIGRAAALALAAEGCHVHLAARSADVLAEAKAEIEGKHHVEVTVHPTDLGTAEGVGSLAAACAGVDILVNNAGAIPGGDLEQIDDERWRDAWNLKVFGYINLTRAIYGSMKKRGRGVIVNVIGLAGEKPSAEYIAGSAGNAGLMGFTKALGGAAPADGIRVVGINPGLVATDRMVTLLRGRAETQFNDPGRWREFLEDLPFGRAAEAAEVGELVAFLASERAGYINGTIVTIDGGQSVRGK